MIRPMPKEGSMTSNKVPSQSAKMGNRYFAGSLTGCILSDVFHSLPLLNFDHTLIDLDFAMLKARDINLNFPLLLEVD